MKRFLALGAMALAVVLMLADDAFAQRRGGFGGVRAGGFGGAGFRAGAVGFRGGAVGFRGARFGIGTRSFAARPGIGFRRAGLGWGGWAGRRPFLRAAAFRRGVGWGGWGWPLAGLGYASYASSSCLIWDGIQWVNTCSYSYGYPSYSLGYGWGGWGGNSWAFAGRPFVRAAAWRGGFGWGRGFGLRRGFGWGW